LVSAYRNTASHRTFDLGDVTMASEVVLLGDLLLRMLNPLAHDSSRDFGRLGTNNEPRARLEPIVGTTP